MTVLGRASEQGTRLFEGQARTAAIHLRGIAVAEVADEVRPDGSPGEELRVDSGVVEARHRSAIQPDRTRGNHEICALERRIAKRGDLRYRALVLA